MSDKRSTFDEISPLQMREMQTIHDARAKRAEAGLFTPTGKRKRSNEHEKENMCAKVSVLKYCIMFYSV